MHVQGLAYDVNTSDGASVGYNADSTTNGTIWYTWYAETEGVYLFQANSRYLSARETGFSGI